MHQGRRLVALTSNEVATLEFAGSFCSSSLVRGGEEKRAATRFLAVVRQVVTVRVLRPRVFWALFGEGRGEEDAVAREAAA